MRSFFPVDNEYAGHKDGWIGPDSHADKKGKREIVDDFPTKNEEGQNNEKGSPGGQQGAAKSLIDAWIDNFNERAFAPAAQIFPDPVENHDCVIEGITDDGQKRGHCNQGKFLVEYGKSPHG